MKRSLLFLLMLTIATTFVKAQTGAGNMVIGGGLSINSTSFQGGGSASSTSFSPRFGYFIADQFEIGAALSLGSSSSGGGVSTSSFGFGPYARYYKFTSNENFAFYGQATILFTSFNNDLGAAEVKSGSTSLAISPGFSYFLNEHWGIDLQMTLLSVGVTDPNKDNDNDKYTSVSFGINSIDPTIGIRYYFGGN